MPSSAISNAIMKEAELPKPVAIREPTPQRLPRLDEIRDAPTEQLPALRKHAELSLAATTPRPDAQTFVALISGLIPKRVSELNDPRVAAIFERGLVDQMMKLPPVVLDELRQRAPLAFEWMPSIKELWDLASKVKRDLAKTVSMIADEEQARSLYERRQAELTATVNDARENFQLDEALVRSSWSAAEKCLYGPDLTRLRRAIRDREHWALDCIVMLADVSTKLDDVAERKGNDLNLPDWLKATTRECFAWLRDGRAPDPASEHHRRPPNPFARLDHLLKEDFAKWDGLTKERR
jgi:hypothetical protein